MREVTLLNSSDARHVDGHKFGRSILVDDEELSHTRLVYLLLALCGRAGVEQCTLDPNSRENPLRCRHASGAYLSADDLVEPPPAHIRHYLVYHFMLLACPTGFTARLCWAIAQILPGAIKARIHVRYKETTYHWNAVFRRRAVMFHRIQ